MEELSSPRFDIGNAIRKKRSQTSRRPKPDSQAFSDYHDLSLSSTTPHSEDASKDSSDENGVVNFKRKELNLNQCMPRGPAGGTESEKARMRNKESGALYNNDVERSAPIYKRSSEGVLAPANWKSTSKILDSESKGVNAQGGRNGECHSSELSRPVLDTLGNENKVKKVKLRVGGATRTIHADSATNGVCSMKNSKPLEIPGARQKLQGNNEEYHSSDKRTGLQGVPWKDFSGGRFSLGKEVSIMGKTSGKGISGRQGDKSDPVRKSKRVPKKRVLDGDFDEDDEDDEIRYLERLKTSKASARIDGDDEESGKKRRKLSTMENIGASGSAKDGKKKSRPERVREDVDFEEEEMASDDELEGNKKKKQKKEPVDSLMEGKREMSLTTRQRAMQSNKDGTSAPGSNLIEFPNGLPPAPSRKQKEKLTEVEQQLKKAEAAQRRRMQVEKAARESEAEAIRKILGQDSSRKKREQKLKMRQEELAKEKADNAKTIAPNTIRCVMSPTGTIVTFSENIGLPSIFASRISSYPPAREKCAGPSCTNPYKYRDSMSKLPLCSLQCYKAIREQAGN